MDWSNLFAVIAIIAKSYKQGWNDHTTLSLDGTDQLTDQLKESVNEYIRNTMYHM